MGSREALRAAGVLAVALGVLSLALPACGPSSPPDSPAPMPSTVPRKPIPDPSAMMGSTLT